MADSLKSLIEKNARAEDISALFEKLSFEARFQEIKNLPARFIKDLFVRVEGYRSWTIDDLAPKGGAPRAYRGRNSMPAFRGVEKQVWRASSQLVGWNHHFWEWFSGPGYFLAENGERGELVFRYDPLPSEVPPEWPPLRPNTGFGSGIVYKNLIDYCRSIANNTFIGSAYRREKSLDTYFLVTLVEP